MYPKLSPFEKTPYSNVDLTDRFWRVINRSLDIASNLDYGQKKEFIDKLMGAIESIINDTSKKISAAYMCPAEKTLINSKNETYEKKIERLLSIAQQVKYEPDTISRSRNRVISLNSLKNKRDKFFKHRMTYGKRIRKTNEWNQAILVHAHKRHNEHAVNMTVGEVILPIRIMNGKLYAGITAKYPYGTCGNPIFTAPKTSFSNPDREDTSKTLKRDLWQRTMWSYSQRMMGKDLGRITICPKSEKIHNQEIVWFDKEELESLIGHEYMEDSSTIALINRLLATSHELMEEISFQGKKQP